jgi:2,3-bisphosphoglycerate-independent phosphoglycerate mutase
VTSTSKRKLRKREVKRPRPIMLIILDGWGINPEKAGNAVALARTPVMDGLLSSCPSTLLGAAGEAVGLPEGQMGNSEVGHLNLGAGRIVYQELTRITEAIKDGSFFQNSAMLSAIDEITKRDAALHLMGLLSDGGVHSHIEHLYAILDLAKRHNLKKVFVHAFLDGRDVGPRTALRYIKALEERLDQIGLGKLATLMGRYYGMDRDYRWKRTELAYRALTAGQGRLASSGEEGINLAYDRGQTDEFVLPTVIIDQNGQPLGVVSDDDVVLFFNFRADRARQITRAFIEEGFSRFKRELHPKVHYVCLTQYNKAFDLPVAFPPQKLNNVLAEVLSRVGLRQLHIAETEKYAHVTFFFDGGVERPFPHEDRILIPSPKVATYDLKPQMSAFEVTHRAIEEIESCEYDFIVLNYANTDMVGHTGVLSAAVKAIETVDECLGMVLDALGAQGGMALVTADHGNAEKMIDSDGEPFTAHTTNPVFFLIADRNSEIKLVEGVLADVAPTILDLLGIEKPQEMTGKSLIK